MPPRNPTELHDVDTPAQVAVLQPYVAAVGGTVATPPQGTQGIVRIAKILRHIAAHNADGLKLAELARAFEMEPSTAHRVIAALHSVGFVFKDPKTRKFHLGPLVFELFTTAAPHFDAREICRPAMQRLADKIGDTMYLTVRSGLDGVCIERVEGGFEIRTCTVSVGHRRPLGIGAGSLALLAAYPEAEAETIIAENSTRYAQFKTDADTVRARVHEIRSRGYHYGTVLNTTRIRCVAVALLGHTGHPFAGLSVTAIDDRLTDEERVRDVVDALVKEAAGIQNLLREKRFL
jgi:DNA-binding IclR family transcriptional regulator